LVPQLLGSWVNIWYNAKVITRSLRSGLHQRALVDGGPVQSRRVPIGITLWVRLILPGSGCRAYVPVIGPQTNCAFFSGSFTFRFGALHCRRSCGCFSSAFFGAMLTGGIHRSGTLLAHADFADLRSVRSHGFFHNQTRQPTGTLSDLSEECAPI
jgi:hypothetical protein